MEGDKMKAFLTAVVAAILIAVAAAYGLDTLELSSAKVYSSADVRL
jgi:hypothetical protein